MLATSTASRCSSQAYVTSDIDHQKVDFEGLSHENEAVLFFSLQAAAVVE